MLAVLAKIGSRSELLDLAFDSANELVKDQIDFLRLALLLHLIKALRLVVEVKLIDNRHEVFVVHIYRDLIC